MTNSPTPLQKAVERLDQWPYQSEAFVIDLRLVTDAAKQLSALQTENEELSGHLKHIAFTYCGIEIGKPLEGIDEPETDVSMVASFVEGQIDEQAFRADKAEQDRDSIKSVLESMTKENVKMREALIDELPSLVCSFVISQHLPACDSYNNPEDNWCGICKRRKRVNDALSTTHQRE